MIDFSRFNSLYELTDYFSTEERCKRAIKESRWDKNDIVCPYCGGHHCVERKDGRYRCNHCRRNFSVTVGTIFEDTKVSLRKWFIAMYLISTHKKGVSSVQLATDIHVTQLDKYIDEAVYRFNTKEMDASARFSHMFERAIGTCYYSDVKIAA